MQNRQAGGLQHRRHRSAEKCCWQAIWLLSKDRKGFCQMRHQLGYAMLTYWQILWTSKCWHAGTMHFHSYLFQEHRVAAEWVLSRLCLLSDLIPQDCYLMQALLVLCGAWLDGNISSHVVQKLCSWKRQQVGTAEVCLVTVCSFHRPGVIQLCR